VNNDSLAPLGERAKGRVSAIWLLPFIALLIGGWLIFKAVSEAPIEITIAFDRGEGIEAGKTEVHYEGIKVGVVTSVIIQADKTGIIARLDMDRGAADALRENTQFWLVKPEVSLSGISGIGTVLSGNYITARVGDGAFTDSFVALSSPPPKSESDPGLHLSLKAKDLGSITVGSPIIYKKFTIGDVQAYRLSEDGNAVSIDVFIKPEYVHLVRSTSRFWNASGISIKGGLTSFDVRTESIAALIKGGIGLTPVLESEAGPLAANGEEFELYEDYSEAQAGTLLNVVFPFTPGIESDVTKVVYRGMVIGQVEDVRIADDLSTMLVTLALPPMAVQYLNAKTRIWVDQPNVSLSNLSAISGLLSGTRIELDFDGRAPDDSREFLALTQPPIPNKNAPGLHVTLTVDTLKSATRGMALLYRNIRVGSVLDYHLSKDEKFVELDVHIQPEYSHLVNNSSRFWDASGVEVSGGLSGIKVRAASLTSILLGGISFYSPNPRAASVNNGQSFRLYQDFESAHSVGVPITINFDEGDGLKVGTAIKYEGIEIGKVTSVSLNRTLDGVVVKASLMGAAGDVAREHTRFWMVKPELGLAKTANLETLITGQYITFDFGDATIKGDDAKTSTAKQYLFTALSQPPAINKAPAGLNITLTAPKLASIHKGTKVSYRGVAVGKVMGFQLADMADHVEIFVNIEEEYQALVRDNSRFWNASGLDVGFKLFGGANIKTDSVESLLVGGISFATPGGDELGSVVEQGAAFSLSDSRDERWTSWGAQIHLNRAAETHE